MLCWGDEDGHVEAALKAAGRNGGTGNVRACFCGHSHKNDFHFEEDGILFACGRATGHGGYGGEALKKGAKFIDLGRDRDDIAFRTVFAAEHGTVTASLPRRDDGLTQPGMGS